MNGGRSAHSKSRSRLANRPAVWFCVAAVLLHVVGPQLHHAAAQRFAASLPWAPAGLIAICTATGLKYLNFGDPADEPPGHQPRMSCPLCLAAAAGVAAPPDTGALVLPVSTVALVDWPVPVETWALAGAPSPFRARAPPV